MALENILPLPPAPSFTLQTEKGSEWQLSTLVLASGLAGANSMKGCNLGDFPTHAHTHSSSHCSLDPGKRAALVWRVWSKDPPFPQGGGEDLWGRTALKALFPIR